MTRSINTHDQLRSAFKPSRRRTLVMFGSVVAVYTVLYVVNAPIGLTVVWLCGAGGWAIFFARHEIAPGVLVNGVSLLTGRVMAATEKTRSSIEIGQIPEHELAIYVRRSRLMFAFVLIVSAFAFLVAMFNR